MYKCLGIFLNRNKRIRFLYSIFCDRYNCSNCWNKRRKKSTLIAACCVYADCFCDAFIPVLRQNGVIFIPVMIILLVKVFDVNLYKFEIIKNTFLYLLVLFVFIRFWDYKNLHDYKFVDIKSPLLTAQQVSNDKENNILVFLKWDYVPYIAYYKEKLNITFKHAVCMLSLIHI